MTDHSTVGWVVSRVLWVLLGIIMVVTVVLGRLRLQRQERIRQLIKTRLLWDDWTIGSVIKSWLAEQQRITLTDQEFCSIMACLVRGNEIDMARDDTFLSSRAPIEVMLERKYRKAQIHIDV